MEVWLYAAIDVSAWSGSPGLKPMFQQVTAQPPSCSQFGDILCIDLAFAILCNEAIDLGLSFHWIVHGLGATESCPVGL